MDKFIEDTLRGFFGWVAGSVRFATELVGVVFLAAALQGGELVDDLTTYKNDKIDWVHVVKGSGAPVIASVALYIKHKQLVADALAKEPPL